MAELNKDLKKVYEVLSSIYYFKLISIEKQTYKDDYDTFKNKGGEALFHSVVNANKLNCFPLRDTNYSILTNLRMKIDTVKQTLKQSKSIDNTTIKALLLEMKNLDWLDEVIKDLIPSEIGYEAIINNASLEVQNKLIKLEFLNMTSREQDKKIMLERVKELKEISKSF